VQITIAAAGLLLAAILQSIAGGACAEVITHLFYLCALGIAGALCFLGRPDLVTTAFIGGHLYGTLTCVVISYDLLPNTSAARALFQRRLELIPEALLSIHTQVRISLTFLTKSGRT
jgi:hypothetical protein